MEQVLSLENPLEQCVLCYKKKLSNWSCVILRDCSKKQVREFH